METIYTFLNVFPRLSEWFKFSTEEVKKKTASMVTITVEVSIGYIKYK